SFKQVNLNEIRGGVGATSHLLGTFVREFREEGRHSTRWSALGQKPTYAVQQREVLIRSPRRRGNQTLLQVAAFIRLRATTAEVNITYTASVAAVASTTPAAINGSMVNHIVCRPIFPTLLDFLLQFFATLRPPVKQSGL